MCKGCVHSAAVASAPGRRGPAGNPQIVCANDKASQSVTVKAGTVLRFTNNDVMPHRLVQAAGPRVRLAHPNMIKMASSSTVKLTQKGVYRFTTKAGEDYAWAGSMKTVGEDNVLHLTVRVK
jgi:plastocyanin